MKDRFLMTKRLGKIFITLLTFSIILSGCSVSSSNDEETERPKSVTVWTKDVIERDPVLTTNESQYFLNSLLYENLFVLDKDNKVKPNIAKSYSISDDGFSITIDLDSKKTFTDGKKITSTDVKRTLSRLAMLDSKSAASIKTIKGSGEAKSGADFFGIATPTASKIVFSFIAPNPFFIYSLSQPAFALIPSEALNEKNELISDVGSGKYTIGTEALTVADATVFVPRDRELPEIKVFTKTQEEINTLNSSSNVDMILGQAPRKKDFKIENIEVLANASWNIYVKDATSPLSDVRFRQAILLAIDSDTSFAAYGDRAIMPSNFSGATVDAVDCSSNCETNKSKAKTLLNEIFPTGVIPNVSIDIEDSEVQKSLSSTAQKDLTEVGIPSTITTHVPGDFANAIARGEIGLFRFGWVSNIPVSSESLVDNFKADSPDNLSGVVDATLEKDIATYEASKTISTKIQNSKAIQERIKDLFLSKPIAQFVSPVSISKKLKTPKLDCYGRLDLTKIFKLDD